MSLADRLQKPKTNCYTCRWYDQLDDADRFAFDAHIAGGGSVRGLYRACIAEYDPDGAPIENPLRVARSSFQDHVRDCHNERMAARVAV